MSATLTQAPDRSLAQRFAALERANDTRLSQVRWKAEMADRPVAEAAEEAARVLREVPDSLGSLSIHTFLMSVPQIGDTKAQEMLTRGGWYIWPFRKVRDLTDGQRNRLAAELERFARPLGGLTVIESAILRWIGDGCCYAADISEGVGLEPRTMGARLRGLHMRGMVVWEGPRHRRSWRLTDAGRAGVLG